MTASTNAAAVPDYTKWVKAERKLFAKWHRVNRYADRENAWRGWEGRAELELDCLRTEMSQPTAAPLSDADIQRIANEGVKAGELSWVGFDKDALGFFTVPVLSRCHFQLARLVARAAPSTEAAPVEQDAALTGAQFAAAQHLHTVQVQADALAALRVERDLLSASLKQRDGLVDQLVAALKNAHPYVTSDAARIEIGAALASAGETS